MKWHHVMKKFGLSGGWHENAILGKYGYGPVDMNLPSRVFRLGQWERLTLSAQIFWRVITRIWNAVAISTGKLPAQGRMPLPCSVSYSRLYYRKLKVTYKKDTQITICYIFFFFLHWVMDYIEGYGKQSITIWTKQIEWQMTLKNSKKKS